MKRGNWICAATATAAIALSSGVPAEAAVTDGFHSCVKDTTACVSLPIPGYDALPLPLLTSSALGTVCLPAQNIPLSLAGVGKVTICVVPPPPDLEGGRTDLIVIDGQGNRVAVGQNTLETSPCENTSDLSVQLNRRDLLLGRVGCP